MLVTNLYIYIVLVPRAGSESELGRAGVKGQGWVKDILDPDGAWSQTYCGSRCQAQGQAMGQARVKECQAWVKARAQGHMGRS